MPFVSVPHIAVADAAPVYSRIILYEVNSLYIVTLYFVNRPLYCTCMERTAYRGDIFESDKADRYKQTVGPLIAASFVYIYIYIYIYDIYILTSCMFYFIRTIR